MDVSQVPEHLLRRAQQAKDRAASPDTRGLPEHLLHESSAARRAQQERATSREAERTDTRTSPSGYDRPLDPDLRKAIFSSATTNTTAPRHPKQKETPVTDTDTTKKTTAKKGPFKASKTGKTKIRLTFGGGQILKLGGELPADKVDRVNEILQSASDGAGQIREGARPATTFIGAVLKDLKAEASELVDDIRTAVNDLYEDLNASDGLGNDGKPLKDQPEPGSKEPTAE